MWIGVVLVCGLVESIAAVDVAVADAGSNIDNLLPLCHRHHHSAHEGHWQLALDTRRNLTITYPDGNIMTTGPPTIRSP